MVACLCMGLKLDLTPFNAAGGAELNLGAGEVEFTLRKKGAEPIPACEGQSFVTEPWNDLVDGMPPGRSGLMLPSGYGWDPWYWDIVPKPLEGALPRGRSEGVGLSGVTEVVDTVELCNETDAFFAVPVEGELEADRVVAASAGEAGRYLALLAGPIHAAVPEVRFRTELATWAADAPDATVPGPKPDRWAEKLVWLQAVLSEGLPAELRRWRATHAARADRGLGGRAPAGPGPVPAPAATGRGGQAEAEAWLADEEEAGFRWPPEGWGLGDLRAGDLLHEVGFHWFHDVDTTSEKRSGTLVYPWGYADAVRLGEDAASLAALVAELRIRDRWQLSSCMMAANFPAVDPQADPAGDPRKFYALADGRLQGAMLLRTLLTGLGAGLQRVGWFTFCYGEVAASAAYGKRVPYPGWQSFASDGLRNDVLYDRSGAASYLQSLDCWPRPAWYGLRRLNWLLSKRQRGAAGVRVVASTRGLTVVRIELSAKLEFGPDGLRLAGGPYRRCFVGWVDQYASSSDLHAAEQRRAGGAVLRFVDNTGDLSLRDAPFALVLPLVPQVSPTTVDASGAPGTNPDGNGYATAVAPDWAWPGFDSALASVHIARARGTGRPSDHGGAIEVDVTVAPCSPESEVGLAPVALLTNLEFEGEVA